MRWMLRSKIHNATVTRAEIDYVGSISIDRALIDRAGLRVGEKVLVVDLTNGARVETYIIHAESGSGEIGMNGAAAHLIKEGDRVIIMGFELTDKQIEPCKLLVDEDNRFVRHL